MKRDGDAYNLISLDARGRFAVRVSVGLPGGMLWKIKDATGGIVHTMLLAVKIVDTEAGHGFSVIIGPLNSIVAWPRRRGVR
jgi:hypothetical protein